MNSKIKNPFNYMAFYGTNYKNWKLGDKVRV